MNGPIVALQQNTVTIHPRVFKLRKGLICFNITRDMLGLSDLNCEFTLYIRLRTNITKLSQ